MRFFESSCKNENVAHASKFFDKNLARYFLGGIVVGVFQSIAEHRSFSAAFLAVGDALAFSLILKSIEYFKEEIDRIRASREEVTQLLTSNTLVP